MTRAGTSGLRTGREFTVSSTFRAIGIANRIVATDATSLPAAIAVARDDLAELDRAASRFRTDSELSRICADATTGDVTVTISPRLSETLQAVLRAADLSGGLVDPTVGNTLVAAGYDDDLAMVRARSAATRPEATHLPRDKHHPAPGRCAMTLDPATRTLTVRKGTLIDVGAGGKAAAADRLARILAARFAGGFLVDLGGDIAVAGPGPAGGWRIAVAGPDGSIRQVVRSPALAYATSSTQLRTWQLNGQVRHHIVDPRTGAVAEPYWAQVTCAGASALEANSASTSAVVLGPAAIAWLAERQIPARLERPDGHVTTTAGWPTERAAT